MNFILGKFSLFLTKIFCQSKWNNKYLKTNPQLIVKKDSKKFALYII